MKLEEELDVRPEDEKKKGPWKERFLYGALGASVAASLLWLIAISTNYWVFWDLPSGTDGIFRPTTRTFLLSQYAGMWQICRKEKINETSETNAYCSPMNFFPSDEEIERDAETDRPILTGCIVVAIETFQSMILYEKSHLPARYPPQSNHRFGFSYGLAWVCFVLFVTSSLVLFVYSRKKKDKGDDDDPVIIGRI